MLKRSDIDIRMPIADLATFGIEAAYLVPTKVGLGNGLMDAHSGIRRYLLASGTHDYSRQAPGTKSLVVGRFLTRGGWVRSRVSLYKPDTKSGDPRIWFYGLHRLVEPWNLLVVFAKDGELHFVNASDPLLWRTFSQEGSDFYDLLMDLASDQHAAENELLALLRDIAGRGFIPSSTNADSGVGDTLEGLLGLKRNAKKTPDFKGIELKASRLNSMTGVQRNRNVLFAESPDWAQSDFQRGQDFIDAFGYTRTGTELKALQVTLNNRPNAQTLYLALNESKYLVEGRHGPPFRPGRHVVWDLAALESRLAEKHRATFWVKAHTELRFPTEHFQYVSVKMTTSPLVSNFGPLVASGVIQMDYTFSEKYRNSGRRFVRDHGYLWKIRPDDLELLFPPPRVVDLLIPAP